MATFAKRGNTWRAQVRRRGISISETFLTKAQAQAWAAKVEADIAAGKLGQMPNKTFAALLIRYRDEVSPRKKGARWEQVRINKILRDASLADVSLPDLSPAVFSAWRDNRLQEVTPGSVLREWNLLSAACSVAVDEWGWLSENPLKKVKRPKPPKPRERRPQGNELERVLLALGYSEEGALKTATARVGLVALFAIETGMRQSEICGLTANDIDLEKRYARLPDTKNDTSRFVPLSLEAIRLLKRLPETDGPVFGVAAATVSTTWRRACSRALIDNLRFHDLRAEALTRLAGKVDVLDLAKISGHKDLKILLETYYRPNITDLAKKLD